MLEIENRREFARLCIRPLPLEFQNLVYFKTKITFIAAYAFAIECAFRFVFRNNRYQLIRPTKKKPLNFYI